MHNDSQGAFQNQSQQRFSRYDDQQREEDEMMKSSSSFGLPSEFDDQNLSDKEIMSDLGASRGKKGRTANNQINASNQIGKDHQSQAKIEQELNSTQKPFIANQGLDVSFENFGRDNKSNQKQSSQQNNINKRNRNEINLNYQPIEQIKNLQNKKFLNRDIDDLSDLIDSPSQRKQNGLNNKARDSNILDKNGRSEDAEKQDDINNTSAKFSLPLYHNRHQESLVRDSTRKIDDKDLTQSTQNFQNTSSHPLSSRRNPNLHINIQNMKQSQKNHSNIPQQRTPNQNQPNNLLNKQNQQQQLQERQRQEQNRIIEQNLLGSKDTKNKSYLDKSAAILNKDRVAMDKTNLQFAPLNKSSIGNDYPQFINQKEGVINVNDDSYISANSGLNLLTGNFDNSFSLPDNKNLSDRKLINNNYQNQINLRQSADEFKSSGPSLQNGFIQKIIQNHTNKVYQAQPQHYQGNSQSYQDTQQNQSTQNQLKNKQIKITPRLNLDSIAELQSINQKSQSQSITQKYQNQKTVGFSKTSKMQHLGNLENLNDDDFGMNQYPSPLDHLGRQIHDTRSQDLNHQRNFSADQEIKTAIERKKKYEQTISDALYNTNGPITQRESNQFFDFDGESEMNLNNRNNPFTKIYKNQVYIPDDASERSKFIKMPDVYASKTKLQQEIGHLLSKQSDDHFNEEIRYKKDMEVETVPFYRIVDKDPLDVVNDYVDRCPCLDFRKFLMKARIIINRIALVIISNRYFETISICVILANSMFLALNDPLTTQQPAYQSIMDNVFQYLYTFEMGMKIIGYGFIFNKGAYLRDAWNILDFIIVTSGYLSIILSGGGVNLSVLRSFRVIRPLRTISSIQGLRVIVQALISSMPLLRDTILVLAFFFLIFGIAGVQLFQGVLMNRCFDIETGIADPNDVLCGGGTSCLPGQQCGKTIENPNYGATNFDNIFYGFLMTFQTVTLEGWTGTMVAVEQTVGQWTIIYFVPIVFIGSYFLLNLTLAVIMNKFTEEHNKSSQKMNMGAQKKKKPKIYGDESEEDDINVINYDGNDDKNQQQLTKVQQKLKEIEENQELSPRSKKKLKDKAKLEELMKRIDFAIKQREVKDRITPRGSSLYSNSQQSIEKFNSNPSLKHHLQGKFTQSKANGLKLNYADIFNSKYFTKSPYQNDGQKSNLNNSFCRIEDQMELKGAFNPINSSAFALNQSSRLQFQRNQDNHPIREDDQELSSNNQELSVFIEQEGDSDKFYANSDQKIKSQQQADSETAGALSKLGGEQETFNRTSTMNKNKISPWLGKVFEISRQPQNYQPNYHHNMRNLEIQPNSARLLMGGFAGIKAKVQVSEKADSEEIKRLKKEIYDKIAKNFNMFEFFENENPGDDEFSGDEQFLGDEIDLDQLNSYSSSRGNRLINDDELIQSDIQIQNNNQSPDIKFQRKSTMATVETKSLRPRHFNFNPNPQNQPINNQLTNINLESRNSGSGDSKLQSSNSSQPQNEQADQNITQFFSNMNHDTRRGVNESGIAGLNDQNTFTTTTHINLLTSSANLNQSQFQSQIKQRNLNQFKRRSTISPVKGLRGQKPIDELISEGEELQYQQQQPGQQQEGLSERGTKHKRQDSESLGKRAFKFLQGCTRRKQKRGEMIEADFQELLRKSRSQQHSQAGAQNKVKPIQLIQKTANQNYYTQQNQNKTTDKGEGVSQKQQFNLGNQKANTQSVRAKSEHQRGIRQKSLNQKFKEKEEKMKKRRSQFFAQALKDIGKNPDQINQELKERARRRRFIELKGGFTTTKQAKRKLLMRSGTIEFIEDDPINQKEKKLGELDLGDYEDEDYSPSQDGDRTAKFQKENQKYMNKMVKKKQTERELEHDIPDMDQTLKEKQKKLVIRMKNYKFSSVNDIFAGRDGKLIEALHQNINHTQKSKVIFAQKKFFEDLLMNEVLDSDDNQETVLKRIEEEYNVDHRSNIHVTGTLSLVINKPHAENKMMNKNYYDQLNPPRKFGTILEEPKSFPVQSAFAISKENSDVDEDINNIYDESSVHYPQHQRIQDDQRSARSQQQINPNVNQSQELNPIQRLGNTLKLKLERTNTKLSGGSGGRGKVQTARANNMLRRKTIRGNGSSLGTDRKIQSNRQQLSVQIPAINSLNNSASKKVQNSNTQNATKEINYYLPRPEALTEKQILKRLNNEVKKSKVFSSTNFKKLPQSIGNSNAFHLENEQEKKKKKKKKKVLYGLQAEHHYDEDDEEFSETSEDEIPVNNDYFVDRDLNYLQQIEMAKFSSIARSIDKIEWSGQDIIQRLDPYKARLAIGSLNKIRVWQQGPLGLIKRSRVALKHFMKGMFVENFMTLCVFANTLVLSLDYYGISQALSDALNVCNTLFTIIFAVEMFFKILAIGIARYGRDKLNIMDGCIVVLSMVELIFLSGQGALKAFRSVRIIRAFRVLRVARLLRGLKSMMNIIAVIQRSISSFMYLAILLFLFVFIYALLGMQVFGGNFPSADNGNRYNFDSFNNAFVTSFDLLSTENWNNTMFFAMGGPTNKYIIGIYFISCIFIGNYMLLNLFLSILLDSFTAVEEEDHDTPEKRVAREKQRISDLQQKEGEKFIQGLEEIDMDNANSIGNKKKKKKKKQAQSGSRDAPISNILDESVEIDLETLYQRQQEIREQKNILFKGIECETSVYLFSKVVVSSNFDYVFTSVFALEMLLKWTAFGFVMDKGSYLRESWSQLDCFIVTTSLIDASLSTVNLPIIKILRLLRILRPLRFISHNSSMKTIVVALISSMGAILNVGVVILVIFLMYAILGVNLFGGKVQFCTVNTYTVNTPAECFQARGEWQTYVQHFDNVLRGMITLFVISNQEGWPDVMYHYTDITGVGTGPKHGESPGNAYFFVVFVFIGSFFFMNLFVGVLFMNFEAAQRDEKEAMLLDGDEMKWVDMMKMIIKTKPDIIKTPKNALSQFLYKHTKPQTKFDFVIMTCIILNMLQMAMNFEGSSQKYQQALNIANYIFTGVFTLECILKIIGHGASYFAPTWHRFDIFVVFCSLLDIILNQLSSAALKPLKVAPQLLRILRVLRVTRLFKLLNKYKGLQALLQTIIFAVPSIMNVFALVVLVYCMFAILGVFMFQNITNGNIIDPVYMNFTNFHQALLILLRCSTGEDWPTVMYDTMNTDSNCIPGSTCGLSYSPVFFLPFIMVVSYVMLNLFVLIILQQFELYYLPQDNILQQFRDDLQLFKNTWMKFSKEFDGLKIKSLDLVNFFKQLEGNLGMKDDLDKSVMRNLVKMNLEGDEEGFIFFNELLFKAMKRIYGQERTKKRMLVEFELKTLEKLQNLKIKQQMSSRKKQRLQAVTVNPFLTVMYKNMSFKAWLKIFRQNLDKRGDEIEYNLDRDSSDEEMVKDDGYELVYVTEVDEPYNSGGDEIIAEESSQYFSDEESARAHAQKRSRVNSPTKFQNKRSNKTQPFSPNSPDKSRHSRMSQRRKRSEQQQMQEKNLDSRVIPEFIEKPYDEIKQIQILQEDDQNRQKTRKFDQNQTHHHISQDLQLMQEDQILSEQDQAN